MKRVLFYGWAALSLAWVIPLVWSARPNNPAVAPIWVSCGDQIYIDKAAIRTAVDPAIASCQEWRAKQGKSPANVVWTSTPPTSLASRISTLTVYALLPPSIALLVGWALMPIFGWFRPYRAE